MRVRNGVLNPAALPARECAGGDTDKLKPLSAIAKLSCAVWLTAAALGAQDGAFLFQSSCAVCHRPGSPTRAPLPELLHRMSRQEILGALETGKMRAQGATLTPPDRVAIASFLGATESSEAAPRPNRCPPASSPFAATPGWNGWGASIGNTRFQPGPIAGLSRDDVARLKLKWAFGFPRASSAFGQPTVVGGRVFIGSADGIVYSLDAATGCVYWTFKASATVRTAVTIGPTGRAAYFADLQASVYSVNAATGALLWKTRVEEHPSSVVTGAPTLYEGRLFVPVSSLEEFAGSNPKYGCCTFRGSVVALNAKTGKQLWKTYTISETPKPTHVNSAGTQMYGPSGAAIWSSPTLDARRHAVYVGTGDGYSDPDTTTSDAVLAFDMTTGKTLWSKQITPNDRWNLACISPDKANCPETPGGDFDIGASPILTEIGARRLLIVGQKSGIVHALDPDQKGKIVWQAQLGAGGILGGIEWGGAADTVATYFPLSDMDFQKPEAGGGMFALQLAGGEKVWYSPPAKLACAGQPGCSSAQLAAATAIPGAVFSGSMDGHLRAYSTSDGKVIWDFDTAREFSSVNGVKGHGGSLNSSGPVVVGGMLFTTSGYSVVPGMPGNVLLAFSVDGK